MEEWCMQDRRFTASQCCVASTMGAMTAAVAARAEKTLRSMQFRTRVLAAANTTRPPLVSPRTAGFDQHVSLRAGADDRPWNEVVRVDGRLIRVSSGPAAPGRR